MKILKKFIPLIVIISIFTSYILPIKVYADDPAEEEVTIEDSEFNGFSDFSDKGLASLDGIVGIILWLPRAICAITIIIAETVVTQVVLGPGSGAGAILEMEDIIFSGASNSEQINLLDVNFFDFNSNTDANMNKIKEAVAKWYYILRNIAIGISLVVLIYLGIRMAISAIAEEQAKYKTMLKDWVVGFVILFSLHIIMVVILNLNSMLIGIIGDAGGQAKLGGYEKALMKNMFSGSFVVGLGSIFIVLLMLGMKIKFFWVYIKRVFTIGFLIVISPLITITYSIDRMGDGKSQALGTWLREFVYNLLIQPFHCIIYLIFVTSGISMLETGTLRGIIFALAAMMFIFKAEEMVKTIFGFKAGSLGKLAGAVALTSLMTSGASAAAGAKGVGAVPGGSGGAGGSGGGPGGSGGSGAGGAASAAAKGVNRKGVPPAGAGGGQSPTPGAGGRQSPTPGGGGQSPAPRTGGQSPAPGTGGQSPTPGGGQSPAPGTGGQSPAPGAAGQSPAPGAAGQSRLDTASTRDKFRSKLNQINSNKGQAAKELGANAGMKIGALAMRAGAKAVKAAPGVAAGLIAAGMTGDTITGFAVGKSASGRFTRSLAGAMEGKASDIDNKVKANQDASMEQALHDQEERDLLANVQQAQDNYNDWHPKDDAVDHAEELLNADFDAQPQIADEDGNMINNPDYKEYSKEEIEYGRSLQALNDFYANDGASDSRQRVLDRVDSMNENKPLSNAVSNLMDSPNYVSQNKLMNNTSKWMQDMDTRADQQAQIKQEMDAKKREIASEKDAEKRKQKQSELDSLQRQYDSSSYLSSSAFQQLGKEEKKVAREIYTSKKAIETRYSSGKDATQADARKKANAQVSKAIAKSYKKSKRS